VHANDAIDPHLSNNCSCNKFLVMQFYRERSMTQTIIGYTICHSLGKVKVNKSIFLVKTRRLIP
jgi:hypothetical protein